MPDLRIPIYSMRSYKTGLYDVTKDGNFQVHLHRMDRDDYVVVPTRSQGIEEFVRKGLVREDRIIYAEYGTNAYETRSTFWDRNKDLKIPERVDRIVTNISGCPLPLPILYYFEITSHPFIKRPYIDEFLDRDATSTLRSNCNGVWVFNDWQWTRLVQVGALGDLIGVNRKVVNPEVLSRLIPNQVRHPVRQDDIFFPFRISDPCYKFEKVLEFARLMNRRVVVTDPNESFKEGIGNIVQIRPTKEEYYSILMDKPTILYFEDPEFCFHPGLGELIFFDCNIVSPYKLPTKSDILIS